jgi:hypothetical protein
VPMLLVPVPVPVPVMVMVMVTASVTTSSGKLRGDEQWWMRRPTKCSSTLRSGREMMYGPLIWLEGTFHLYHTTVQ